MKVSVRYFASIREVLGSGEVVDVPDDASVAQVRDILIAHSPAHAAALSRGRAIRSALGQVLCDETAPVSPGAELAFFPPVTGG